MTKRHQTPVMDLECILIVIQYGNFDATLEPFANSSYGLISLYFSM